MSTFHPDSAEASCVDCEWVTSEGQYSFVKRIAQKHHKETAHQLVINVQCSEYIEKEKAIATK